MTSFDAVLIFTCQACIHINYFRVSSCKTDLHAASNVSDTTPNQTIKMSTNQLVLPVSKIDVNKISFVQAAPKAGRIPGINIKYGGQNLEIRLPRMTSTFGASSPNKNDDGPKNNLGMSLTGCDPMGSARSDESNDVGRFYNFLIDLQDKILNAAIANIKWFPLLPNGKRLTEQNVRDNMKPLLRLHTIVDPSTGDRVPSGKYAPTISFKIPIFENRVTMDIIDNKGLPVYTTPSTLDKVFPARVDANLIATPSIYIMSGGTFGVSWRIKYAQVFSQARVTAADLFADDIEDDDEETAPADTQTHVPTSAETAVDVEIPEHPEEVTPAPAPAPVPIPEAPVSSVRKRRPAAA